MQKSYSEEFKESVIRKMLPPNPVPVLKLSKEIGVSDVTLYKWRKDYRNRGVAMPGRHSKPDDWASADKLAVVIETAALNKAQLSEYCRSKGLYPEWVDQWKVSALSGYQQRDHVKQEDTRQRQEDKRRIKLLESELKRKEKALAEAAALLVLSKKCEAIWGASEED